MVHAFDGHYLSQLLGDIERLAVRAAEHEEQLAACVSALERSNGHDRANGTPVRGIDDRPPLTPDAATVLSIVRMLSEGAREQRQMAEQLLGRFPGNRTLPMTERAAESAPRVLVVDDSDDSRELAATVLEAAGFRTFTANNGLDALIVAHLVAPEVVVMDITMPVLDGIQAARLLLSSELTRAAKIIAYTARPDACEGPLMRLFAGIVAKPTTPDVILTAVQEITHRHRSLGAVQYHGLRE